MGAKRKTKTVAEDAEISDEVKELALAIIESLDEPVSGCAEPFEIYSHQLQMKLFARREEFVIRFAKGYQALINELAKRPHIK